MAEESLTLSVVVTSFNQLAFIQRLTEQLLAQTFPADDYEIIIVDDGSTDGSQEWLREQNDPRIRPLLSNDNRGRSASRNHGIREARGKVIVMIDGDHTIQPDFLERHAARHDKEYCVIVGKSDFVDHPDYRALNFYLNGRAAAKLSDNSTLPGRYFLSGNCSLPRAALLEIGLFDERFQVWGGEDLDLGVRLEDHGLPIYGDAGACAIHHHLRPLPDLLKNMERYGVAGIPLLLEKHPRLFRELNLDRTLSNPFEADRFSAVSRFCYRLMMIAPLYHLVKLFAIAFKRSKLPRVVFDYLHLRQYTRGYRKSLQHTQLH